MKNLVIIHLESLNYLLYKTNPQLFPEIQKVEQEGLFFEKYFSTSTSTLMVIGDLLYGGMEQYEQCKSLDYIPESYFYKSSLFDDLKEQGYNTGLFIFPDGGDRESAEQRHIAGFQNEMILKREYDSYLASIDEIIDNEPFALMACNYISNLALDKHVNINIDIPGTIRWELGYQCLDKSVKDIIDILKNKQLLENTTLILYGDHGDDYWGHGLHTGLTHAIEPYANLIHTPLIMWDKHVCPGINRELISTVDLRSVLSLLLAVDCNETVNMQSLTKRKSSISRSAYAAQPLRAESFNKAYSLTDGKFLIIVSCRGLELYDIEMDPQCSNNFLKYFILQNGVLTFDEKIWEKVTHHFRYFMNFKEIRFLRQKFYYLKEQLYNNTLKLYKVGNRTEQDMCAEMNFNEINVSKDK